jgi:hypothetical protein
MSVANILSNGIIDSRYLPPTVPPTETPGNFEVGGILTVIGNTILGGTLEIGGVPYQRYFAPVKLYDNAIDGGPNAIGSKLPSPQGNEPFSPALVVSSVADGQVWRADFAGFIVSTSNSASGMGVGILTDNGGALVKTLVEVLETTTGFSGGFSIVFTIPSGATSFSLVVNSNGANIGTLTATCEYCYVQRLA